MSASEPTDERLSTGVAGLDEMLGGGIPAGHLVLVTGLPGTGKTTLALQFLVAGLARPEKGIYLSLDEEPDALRATARSLGLALEPGLADRTVELIRLDPRETKSSLERLRASFRDELAAGHVRRLVVDSVSLLNMLSDNEPGRRATLFALANACRAAGTTALFTAEADPIHPEVSRDGLSEYVADGVILLGYQRSPDGPSVSLVLRVLKMRRTAHARTVQPYTLGPNGLVVNARAVDFSAR